MKHTRGLLAITWLSLALVVLAFAGTNWVAAPVWLIFRRAAGLETVRIVAQIAAYLATLCLLVIGALVAIPAALEPGSWLRKTLNVLPLYLLGSTFAALLANLFGIATLGSLLDPSSPVKLSLASAWLGISALLGTVAVTVAAARGHLGDRTLRYTWLVTRLALVPSLILGIAVLAGIGIIMSNANLLPSGGAPVGAAAPGDPAGPGGLGRLVNQFEIGGGLSALFAAIAIVVAGLGWLARPREEAASAALAASGSDYRRQGIQALVSCAVITVVLGLVMQLVPISRDNPPVKGRVQWDSPQTQTLVSRACLNCHSNETEWPWYASIAPGSWITSVHVTSARQQFNLSELTNLSSARKVRLARDMIDQIRSGVMPPVDYVLLHPEARLSDAEKEQLIQGLQNSLK